MALMNAKDWIEQVLRPWMNDQESINREVGLTFKAMELERKLDKQANAQALLQLDQQMTEMQKHNHRHLPNGWVEHMPPLPSVAMEMPPSSLATTPQEDAQSGESTSFETWHLVRPGVSGPLGLMATVTFPASSSPRTHGDVLRFLQGNGYSPRLLTTQESPQQSGPMPPSPQSNGPSAGIEAAGDKLYCYCGADGDKGEWLINPKCPMHGHDGTDIAAATGPEGRLAEEEQGNG